MQVAETLPAEVLAKMHAPPKDDTVPVIDPHTLPEADGALQLPRFSTTHARACAAWVQRAVSCCMLLLCFV